MATLHDNLPMQEYLARPWLTRSKLELAWSRPADYKRRYIDNAGEALDGSEDLAIGSDVDARVVGLPSPCHLVDVKGARTKAYAEAVALHGRDVLTTEGKRIADACVKAVLEHPWWEEHVTRRRAYLHLQATISYECAVTGLPLAVRPDILIGNTLIEVKTTRGPNADDYRRFREYWRCELVRRGYVRQVGMQLDALHALTGVRYDNVICSIQKPAEGRDDAVVRFNTLSGGGRPWNLDTARAQTIDRCYAVLNRLAANDWSEPETHTPQPLEDEDE